MFNRKYGKLINNSEKQINKFMPKNLFYESRSKVIKKNAIFLMKENETENETETENKEIENIN